MSSLAGSLPDFPWDTLRTARKRAEAHPDGMVDLSIGTPVDPTPTIATSALAAAADTPGYPQTAGTPELRDALAGYLRDRWEVVVTPDATLPVIGTKELVAWLPTCSGLGPADTVVYPAAAYPTYAVGARVAGCRTVAAVRSRSARRPASRAGLDQLPVQPDRPDPVRPSPAPLGRLGPRSRGGAGLR